MKNHDHNHQDSIPDGQNIKRRSPNILGLDIELQISLKSGLVVMVVKVLVNDQECGPVSSVGVDQQGEGTKLSVSCVILVIERRQEEDKNDLSHTQQYLSHRSPRVGSLLNLGALSDVINSSSSVSILFIDCLFKALKSTKN